MRPPAWNSTARRHAADADRRAGAGLRDALARVLELADVAGPAITAQTPGARPATATARLAAAAEEPPQEVIGQRRDVLAALAQRRQPDRHDVEAVEQVLAELPVVGQLLQAALRSGDDAHVHRDRRGCRRRARSSGSAGRAAASPAPARGTSSMSSRKIVPPLAISNRPDVILERAGEGAAFVAEQLRLDQRLGQDRAAHRDERTAAPAARVVDEGRDRLLAGAGLADDQHVALAVGDHPHEVEDRPHPRAVPDDDRVERERRGEIEHVAGAYRNADAIANGGAFWPIRATWRNTGGRASATAGFPAAAADGRRSVDPASASFPSEFRVDPQPGTSLVITGAHDQPLPRHRPTSPTSLSATTGPARAIRRIRPPSSSTPGSRADGLRRAGWPRRARPDDAAVALPARAVLRGRAAPIAAARSIATKKREVAATISSTSRARSRCSPARSAAGARVVQYHWGGGTPTYLSVEQIAPARRHRAAPLRRRRRRGARDRDRSARDDARADRAAAAARASTGCRSACRTSTRTCSRRSSGTSRRPRPGSCTGPRGTPASTRSTSTWSTGCRGRRSASFERDAAGGGRTCGRIASPSTPTRTCRGCGRTRRRSMPLDLPDAGDEAPPAGRRDRRPSATPATNRSAWITSRCRTTSCAVAARERRLHRNFMGYTTRPAPDSVGRRRLGDRRRRRRVLAEPQVAGRATTQAIDAGRLPGRARLRAERRTTSCGGSSSAS